jgi:hypothetical protein
MFEDQIKEKNLKNLARLKYTLDFDTTGKRRIEIYGKHDVKQKFNDQIAEHLNRVDQLALMIRELESNAEALERSKLDVIESFVAEHSIDDDRTALDTELSNINKKIEDVSDQIDLYQEFQKAGRKKITELQETQKEYYRDQYKLGLNDLDDQIQERLMKSYDLAKEFHMVLAELVELSSRSTHALEKLRYDLNDKARYIVVKQYSHQQTELLNEMFNAINDQFNMNFEIEKYSL